MSQVGFTGLVDGPRRWDFLAGLMIEQGYKTFVEVGCKEGRTTGHILKVVPDSRVIAIDPWIVQEKSNDPTRETYADWDFEKIEREFYENVGKDNAVSGRCLMLRCTSEEAAGAARTFLVNESADLIFIDALHDYEHVKQDIKLWWPKVRIGGIFATHDFNHKWPGVMRAMAEAFDLMHVGVGPDSVAFVIKQSEDQYRG